MLQLQRNVPMPKARRSPGDRRHKYPFETMQVNDFFFVPGKEKNSIRTYFAAAGKRHNITLRSQLIYARRNADGQWVPCQENDTGSTIGVGVWRTA